MNKILSPILLIFTFPSGFLNQKNGLNTTQLVAHLKRKEFQGIEGFISFLAGTYRYIISGTSVKFNFTLVSSDKFIFKS